MSTIILVVIIAVIAGLAIRSSMKHFNGEGGCCGGDGSSKPKKKKLENKIIKTEEFHVEGMRCANCAYTVTNAINAIDGAAAKVDYEKKKAVVSYDRDVDRETVKAAIRKAGYRVTDK